MGFLGDFSDKFFGGTDDSSQKAQIESNQRTQEFIERQAAMNRADAQALYPAADQYRTDAYNQALALQGQVLPQQIDAFQQGNVGAQNTIIAGMPQYQNAMLGMPVDYSVFQPQTIDYDTSAFQTQLPQFQQPQLEGMQQPTQGQQPAQQGYQTQINPGLALALGGGYR